ncbi:unnamed protein product [Mytilus edulis]|uniref:WSC domain-containing protein n=1 Tax=Mytilus edulis TaxID=6550 RepID=A0A8S3TXM7_MYTED|nr:unnamed protein product [Mytilus edulis]
MGVPRFVHGVYNIKFEYCSCTGHADDCEREQSRVFSTNANYEWFEAKRKCNLLTNEKNFTSFPTRLGWTNLSAKYLPWVEYVGCFKFWNVNRLYVRQKQVTEGEELQECIVHCSGSQFFGLQQSTCICLNNDNRKKLLEYIVKLCDSNVAACSKDPFAFCGSEGSKIFLSVYQKDIHLGFNTGNKTDWKNAFNNCHPHYLASFRTVKSKAVTIFNRVWLSNTRRWTRIIDVIATPYFCVASRIKPNGDVERIIRKCRDRLPALCVEVQKTLTDSNSKTSSTLPLVTTFEKNSTFPGSSYPVLDGTTKIATLEFKETTLPVLEEFPSGLPSKDGVSATVIIATIAATIMMVIVILVTVVMCKRNQIADIALDDMHYQSLGQNRTIVENNYDTMQSTGTAVTSETDRALQRGIMVATEYSQVDVD